MWKWRGWFARPNQLEPEGDWITWLVLAGRGFGKTRCGAEWVQEKANNGVFGRLALVAETAADARDVVVEGPSGLMNVGPPAWRPKYEPSKRRVTWPNGAMATLYSADDPEQLRGPQHDAFWADELAKWRYSESWDQLMFGLRIPGAISPRGIVTTTPKPSRIIQELMKDARTKLTRGSTLDNAANLAPTFLEAILKRYQGTRMGRQEIFAEVLDDVPGALWNHAMLDRNRVKEAEECSRVVVAIDPAVTAEEDSDLTGIVVAGRGRSGLGYVRQDASGIYTPDGWARKAVALYHFYDADRIVAEVNNGGDLVERVIRTVDPNVPFKAVRATRGKAIRAEPVAALYEQNRVKHVGIFADLEDQMCNMQSDGYIGDGSPDRCLVAGTLVATERGDVSIEDVVVGDRVLTRSGYRAVLASRMTDSAAPVVTVHTSRGDICGTPDHLIWTEDGWTRLDALRWGVKLLACQESVSQPSNTAASPITPATASPITTPSRSLGEALCTSICGAMRMAASLFRQDTSSITKTTIRQTTGPAILRPSRESGTPKSIAKTSRFGSILMRAAPIWLVSGNWLPRGTAAQRVGRGTGSMRASNGKIRSSMSFAVSNAVSNFFRSMLTLDIARAPAIAGWPTVSIDTTSMSRARHAEQCSGGTNTSISQRLAPALVVGVSDAGEVAAVYDLTVEGAHEFFANGLLVHNCDALVWAMTDLMIEAGHIEWDLW